MYCIGGKEVHHCKSKDIEEHSSIFWGETVCICRHRTNSNLKGPTRVQHTIAAKCIGACQVYMDM